MPVRNLDQKREGLRLGTDLDRAAAPAIREPEDGPGFGASFATGFAQENLSINAFRAATRDSFDDDPDFSPEEEFSPAQLLTTPELQDATSRDEAEQIQDRKREERRQQVELSQGSQTGAVLGSLAGGILDPVNLIPIPGSRITRGASLARRVTQGAAIGAAESTAAEAFLADQQITRDFSDNLGAALIGGATLGGAIGGLTRPRRGDADLNAVDDQTVGEAQQQASIVVENTLNPGSTTSAASRVAPLNSPLRDQDPRSAEATSSTSPTVEVATGADFRPAFSGPAVGAKALGKLSQKMHIASPALQMAQSRFSSALDIGARLFDTSFVTTGEIKGKVRDIPADVAISRIKERTKGRTSEILKRTLRQANKRRADQGVRPLKSDEFNRQVGLAQSRGDRAAEEFLGSDEVTQAAGLLRSEIINPLSNNAVDVGLLDASIRPTTSESFRPRNFDVDKIKADRNAFKARITEWLRGLLNEAGVPARTDAQRADGEEGVPLRTENDPAQAREAARIGAQQQRGIGTAETEGIDVGQQPDGGPRAEEDISTLTEAIRRGEIARGELDIVDIAERITQKIEGQPDLRSDSELTVGLPGGPGARGTLRERTLDIDDDLIEDFLRVNPLETMSRFIDTVVPDTELQRLARRREGVSIERRAETTSPRTQFQERLAQGGRAEDVDAARAEEGTRSRDQTTAQRAAATIQTKRAELRASLSDSQRATADRIGERVLFESNLADDVKVRINQRLQDDITFAFDRDLVTWVRELGDENLAEGIRRAQDELDPQGKGQARGQAGVTQKQVKLREELRKAENKFAGVVADNQVGELETNVVSEIRREAADLRGAADPKEALKIDRELQNMEQLVRQSFQALRGLGGSPKDPRMTGLVKAGRVARNFNFVRFLGSVVVSSLPELVQVAAVQGVRRTSGDLMSTLLRGMTADMRGMVQSDLQKLGLAMEAQLASPAKARFDTGVSEGEARLAAGFGDRALEASQSASRFAARAFGLTWWMNNLQGMTSRIASDELLRVLEARRSGQGLDADDTQRLARSGISGPMADRILDQFNQFGVRQKDTVRRTEMRVAGLSEWTDGGAAEAMADAIKLDVDRAVISPGLGDTPIWTNNELAKVIIQFKKFALATVERMIIPTLQDPMSGRTAFRVTAGVGMGMGVALIRDLLLNGGPDKERKLGGWLLEGFDRSGLGFLALTADNAVDSLTLGQASGQRLLESAGVIGSGTTRFRFRGPIEELGGPTVGLAETGISNSLRAAGELANTGELDQRTFQDVKRLVPFQNHFLLRGALRAAERANGGSIAKDIPGVKPDTDEIETFDR